MPIWFIFQMACKKDSIRDEMMFTVQKTITYLSAEEYLPLLLAQDPPLKVLKKLGSFLQEMSRHLGLFAVQNYLHEVVTPGVPNFADDSSCVRFWLEVCTEKLKKVKLYVYNSNLLLVKHLNELKILLQRTMAQLSTLFNKTIWLGWNSLQAMHEN